MTTETAGSASREVGSREMEIQAIARTLERCSPRDIAELDLIARKMVDGRGDAQGKVAMPPTGASRVQDLTLENVDEVFRYQPWNSHQVAAGAVVVEAFIVTAKAILRNVPPGPDRSVALRKLREARMDANSAIMFGGRF